MNLLSSFALAMSSALCAALVGCASTSEPATPTVVRTPPPKAYEKTITDYLAFKISGPQKNAEISFGPPEPGACALDSYATSSRGWVVPVLYVTRSGEVTGRESLRINAKQYYFWFLGNTIAGITPRIELCPGVGASFDDGVAPSGSAGGLMSTALPASTAETSRPEPAVAAEAKPPSAKTASGQKKKAASPTKKTSAASAKANKKKTAPAPAKTGTS